MGSTKEHLFSENRRKLRTEPWETPTCYYIDRQKAWGKREVGEVWARYQSSYTHLSASGGSLISMKKKKNTIKCRCICLTQTDLQILVPLPSLKWFSVRTAVILMRCEFIISLIQKICYLSRGNPIIARLICTPQIASWATKFEESTLDIAKLFWVFCNNKVFGPYSSIQVVR